MSKQNKQATALLATLVIGIIFGLLFAPPKTVTVEKPVEVERIVEKPVEKIVEVQDQACKDAMHNFTVSQEVISEKNKGIKVLLEIIEGIDYYLYNPNALNNKIVEAEQVITNLEELEKQYR